MSNIINHLAEEITNQEVLSIPNYNDWNCSYLTDYIVQTHHEYVNQAIPQILPLAKKVVEVHGAKHTPEFRDINMIICSILIINT